MGKSKVIPIEKPAKSVISDYLTDFLREAAQKMLISAVETEVNEFIIQHEHLKMSDDKKRIVRNGHLPERQLQTGIGAIQVKVPRTRDRAGTDDQSIQFKSGLVPKYMRRTVTIDVLLPLLYLKGISTSDFQSALSPILGEDAKAVSPSVISGLKQGWYTEYQDWSKRDLRDKEYVYVWADGIYLQARMESEKSCVLVIIGATADGKKELLAINDGFRESKESWKALLSNLKSRGLSTAPMLGIGDGSLGFWGALTEAFPTTKHQRCWVHKTANVLDKLPKSLQGEAKSMIHEIYLSETKDSANKAWSAFTKRFELKYSKAVKCLVKDKDELLTFYDFPAEHWIHLRTTNPIESTFATVRHRTKKSKNCFSRQTIISSVYKLCREAEKRWRPLNGRKRVAQVLNMEKFIDGIHENEIENNKNEAA